MDTNVVFPKPKGIVIRPNQPVWLFERTDNTMPEWIAGFQYPIDDEGAEALIGTYVNLWFDWAWDEYPDGRKNLKSTWVTITDYNSKLEVHERTFPLAADAFIAAAKRMRLAR